MEIITSDIFGRSVKLTHQGILQALTHPCDDMAHVFAHDPKMVIISRSKTKGAWSVLVEELYDDCEDDSKLKSIYSVTFKDEEIDKRLERVMSTIVKTIMQKEALVNKQKENLQ